MLGSIQSFGKTNRLLRSHVSIDPMVVDGIIDVKDKLGLCEICTIDEAALQRTGVDDLS